MPGSRNRAAWDQDSWLKFRVQSGIPDLFNKVHIFTGVVFVFWFVWQVTMKEVLIKGQVNLC